MWMLEVILSFFDFPFQIYGGLRICFRRRDIELSPYIIGNSRNFNVVNRVEWF